MSYTSNDSSATLLAKFVKHTSSHFNSHAISPELNEIICTFFSPIGEDPSSNIKSADLNLIQTLGIYGPQFEVAVRASIRYISLIFFAKFNTSNFIADSLKAVFYDRPKFQRNGDLIQVFNAFISNKLNHRSSNHSGRNNSAYHILFRKEKHDIINTWLRLFSIQPNSLLFDSIKYLHKIRYYTDSNQSDQITHVFGMIN